MSTLGGKNMSRTLQSKWYNLMQIVRQKSKDITSLCFLSEKKLATKWPIIALEGRENAKKTVGKVKVWQSDEATRGGLLKFSKMSCSGGVI
jgi:hypothetical protein